jgi:surfeit locus 1 family protein
MRRFILPLFFGLSGLIILCGLGTWQVQRLAWKEAILAQIDATIDAAPVALPAQPDPVRDAYRAVRVTGVWAGDTIRVLVSHRSFGAGYRLITPLDVDGRRVLIDRGFLPVAAAQPDLPAAAVTVTGNLHWPQEVDSYTPQNDLAANLWFARDVPALAAALQTEPTFIIARQITPPQANITPLPVDSSAIPNDHLGYAVTWFGLALVWFFMTILALRVAARKDKG